ncbi:MAG: hypothetical protein WCY19_02780 [Candidatus Gastranaerophilaceae bacterium]
MVSENEKEIDCPVCGKKATKTSHQNCKRIECTVCKTFNIGDAFNIPNFTDEEKIKLKYFYTTLSEKDQRRLNPINNKNKEEFLANIIAPQTLLDKINGVMNHLNNKTKYFGQIITIDPKDDYRRFFCINDKELFNILYHLGETGYIEKIPHENTFRDIPDKRKIKITAEGLKYAQTLSNNMESKQCFVAMWFDDSTDELYKSINKAVTGNPNVEKTDFEYGSNYTIMKIDDKHHTNYIPAEIISEIKRSRFMIADLTGYRGGVYYEAGFAEGLNIPVILTCNEMWLNEQKDADNNLIHNGVHFDLKQKNILFWTEETLEQFQRNLVARIGEVVGFNQ